jgi:hypothetical protein
MARAERICGHLKPRATSFVPQHLDRKWLSGIGFEECLSCVHAVALGFALRSRLRLGHLPEPSLD